MPTRGRRYSAYRARVVFSYQLANQTPHLRNSNSHHPEMDPPSVWRVRVVLLIAGQYATSTLHVDDDGIYRGII